MPAAAVIPAPIAYIKVVAVKKLVVGFLCGYQCPPRASAAVAAHPSVNLPGIYLLGWSSDILP